MTRSVPATIPVICPTHDIVTRIEQAVFSDATESTVEVDLGDGQVLQWTDVEMGRLLYWVLDCGDVIRGDAFELRLERGVMPRFDRRV